MSAAALQPKQSYIRQACTFLLRSKFRRHQWVLGSDAIVAGIQERHLLFEQACTRLLSSGSVRHASSAPDQAQCGRLRIVRDSVLADQRHLPLHSALPDPGPLCNLGKQ